MALPVPDDLLTAPGLLPFIVAASLMVMALGLGASAVGRWRQGVRVPILEGRDISTDVKSLILAAAIAVYIAGLQFLAFRNDVVIGDIRHSVTAFEPVTILALAVIMGFPSTLSSLLASGDVRVLATAGAERIYPDVPTFGEVGVEGDVGFMGTPFSVAGRQIC